ncbi:MAG: DUF6443 domain-containing protein [Marinoscillum sp.]|uniref:DUF6443 domain-containing protein n=1 Tax=Marinoscillum sp. TaxID=2024838 RepID=UPI0032F2BFC7
MRQTIYTRFILLLLVLVPLRGIFAQTTTKNFVAKYTARTEQTTALTGNVNENEVIAEFSYFDGLGRPIQTLIRKGSGSLVPKDVVMGKLYDNYGRPDKQPLGYEASTTDGSFQTDFTLDLEGFYADPPEAVSNNTYPYTKQTFDNSPLQRVLEQSSPGETWKPSAEGGTHVVRYEYGVNDEGGHEVVKLEVDLTSDQQITKSIYPISELRFTRTTDENGNTSTIYTNLNGQVVCKQLTSEYGDVRTLYAYDQFGLLTMVVPPEAVRLMVAAGHWSMLNDSTFRDQWLFTYRYDSRRRMIAKKVPGAGEVFMIYDKFNRLVLTQDANMRANDIVTGDLILNSYDRSTYLIGEGGSVTIKPNFTTAGHGSLLVSTDPAKVNANKWMFTKYDGQNRPVITGALYTEDGYEEMLAAVEAHENLPEMYDGSGDFYGYTNTAFPDASTPGEVEVYTVSYYDSYEFLEDLSWPTEYAYAGGRPQARGHQTGSLIKTLGTSDFLYSSTWYDARYRMKAAISQHHLNGYNKVINTYQNKVSSLLSGTVTTHESNGNTTTITEGFTYDHMDRLLSHTHQINGQTPVTLVANDYNAIGELIEKNLGGSAQSVDYRYNERGWLTTINGGTFDHDDGNDKFGLELKYDDSPAGHEQYNGNIGRILWKSLDQQPTTFDDLQYYDFTYDGLNRLKQAEHSSVNPGYSDQYTVSGDDNGIRYDLNGNIKKLTRKYQGTLEDNLTYEYLGNQLTSVGDSASNALFDEEDSEGNLANEYRYDANGNMTSDANKGISNISYNYLNLPEEVVVPEGTIYYTYNALGVKLRKFFDKTSGADETTDYVGGIQYNSEALDFIRHGEGRARKSGASFAYEYNLTDHLGNVRVTVDDGGNVIQRDDYYPFGGTFNSYTSGDKNLYLYQSKEEQEELATYDFEARMYDQWLGRTWQIDPHSENFYAWSTYSWAGNNPISMIDPTGMDWYSSYDKDGNVTSTMWREGSDEIEGYTNIGSSHSYRQGDVTYTYDQNNLSTMEEHVLDEGDFVTDQVYDENGKRTLQCFDASSQMVAKSSAEALKGGTPGPWFSGIQVSTEKATEKGYSIEKHGDANNAMSYLDSEIDNGKSVLIGIDYKKGQSSKTGDGVTDHWVAISSRITNLSTGSKSYRFYDPGTKWSSKGTASSNNFVKNSSGFFTSKNYSGKVYTLTQVRKNKVNLP